MSKNHYKFNTFGSPFPFLFCEKKDATVNVFRREMAWSMVWESSPPNGRLQLAHRSKSAISNVTRQAGESHCALMVH